MIRIPIAPNIILDIYENQLIDGDGNIHPSPESQQECPYCQKGAQHPEKGSFMKTEFVARIHWATILQRGVPKECFDQITVYRDGKDKCWRETRFVLFKSGLSEEVLPPVQVEAVMTFLRELVRTRQDMKTEDVVRALRERFGGGAGLA